MFDRCTGRTENKGKNKGNSTIGHTNGQGAHHSGSTFDLSKRKKNWMTPKSPLDYDPYHKQRYRNRYSNENGKQYNSGFALMLNYETLFDRDQNFIDLWQLLYGGSLSVNVERACWVPLCEIREKNGYSANADVIPTLMRERCKDYERYFINEANINLTLLPIDALDGAIAQYSEFHGYNMSKGRQFDFKIGHKSHCVLFYRMNEIMRIAKRKKLAKQQQQHQQSMRENSNNGQNIGGPAPGRGRGGPYNHNNHNNRNSNGPGAPRAHNNHNNYNNYNNYNSYNNRGGNYNYDNQARNNNGFHRDFAQRVAANESKENNESKEENVEPEGQNNNGIGVSDANGEVDADDDDMGFPDNSDALLHMRRGYEEKICTLFEIPRDAHYDDLQIRKIIEGFGLALNGASFANYRSLVKNVEFDENDGNNPCRVAFIEFYSREIADWFVRQKIRIGNNETWFHYKSKNGNARGDGPHISITPFTSPQNTPR